MAQDPGEETRLVPIGGRQIVVREILDAQVVLIMRLVRNLVNMPADAETREMIKDVAKILDIIDSAVVQQADRDFLEQLIIQRKLNLKELVGVATAFRKQELEQEPPKARRGRPRKQAA